MPEIPLFLIFSLSFFLVALAAKQIGKFFSRYGLPYITGYLLAGALAGPFLLGMLPKEASEELRFVDAMALAIIAFIAGSELYLKELQSRLRSILLNAAGIVIVAFSFLGIALYFLQALIPFTADYPPITKMAVALLGATILLALSPPSTIAVIQDARAKGPFTKTVLSITVVMDVVIIILFALSVAFARAMIDGGSVDFLFFGLLLTDIVLAIAAGFLIGKLIGIVLSISTANWLKALVLLGLGYLIFEAALFVPEWTQASFGFKLKIEPILIAMVAGFTVTNFTHYRQAFEDVLHEISPYVYVAFFALTGLGLKLDVLISTLGIAVILFLVRMVAIIVGSYLGGTVARESSKFKRWAGLGLITQAGIALGLARETAVEFPLTLGGDFATLIISVVVLNEIFGPMLLKYALRKVGEAKTPDGTGARQLLILGIEPQSMALARQLTGQGWRVTVADTDKDRVERLAAEDVDERHLVSLDAEHLRELINGSASALVAMLDDDEANLLASRIAYEDFSVNDIVVRLRDNKLRAEFQALDARIIDPATAMVNLLSQSLRAPDAVDLLLHQKEDYDVMQVEVRDKSIAGMPLRDLRLPSDVLVLEISRAGQSIVPHGFTMLQYGDDVTLVGSPSSLTEVGIKLGD